MPPGLCTCRPALQLAACFCLLLLIVALGGVSLWHMRASRPLEAQARQHALAASLADTLAQQIEFGHSQARAYVQVAEPAARTFYQSNLQGIAQSNAALQTQLASLLPQGEAHPLFQPCCRPASPTSPMWRPPSNSCPATPRRPAG